MSDPASPPAWSGVRVSTPAEHVAEVRWSRPPNNFFDPELLREIADAVEALDADAGCRVVLLAAEGRHFCAGANLQRDRSQDESIAANTYRQGLRLYRTAKPLVAATQGAVVGGGLGLAMAADFRVAADDARYAASFGRLGYYPGFGLTVALPRLVGRQQASLLFATGRRVAGEEARRIGLADLCVPRSELEKAALELAVEIAGSAPLSVQAIRRRMREGLAGEVEASMAFEAGEQARLRQTQDFLEGTRASAERRPPKFTGR